MASIQADAVGTEIRPFEVDVPEADLDELRRRIQATRWPEKETVEDQSQGVQLATIGWGTHSGAGLGVKTAGGRTVMSHAHNGRTGF